MAYADDERHGHSCYFRRQPETAEEIEQAIRAVHVSCCGAVQYSGSDPEILERLTELSEISQRRLLSHRAAIKKPWWRFW